MSGTTLRTDLITRELGWSNSVPASWQVLPCRAIVEEQTEKNENAENQNYLSLMANVGIIPYEEKGDVGNKKPEDLSKCKVVRRGDLVINSMNYGIGSYGLSGLDGVCSPVYIILKPKSKLVHERYALRIFESKSFQKYAQSFGTGILEHRAAIGWDDLKNINIGIPALEEQQALLSYLDRETDRIDALLKKKTRFIELLREKRQALITHAVTKGIGASTKMKISGVEWLGEVPEHWVIKSLKQLARLDGGAGFPDDEQGNRDAPIPFFKVADLANGLNRADNYITPATAERLRAKVFAAGTIAFAKVGAALLLNRRVLMPIPGCTDNNMMVAIPQNISGEWLFFVLSCYDMAWLVNPGAVPSVNQEQVGNIKIPVPPVREQAAIVSTLRSETTRIDEVIVKTEFSIELLKERRSAIITAAVTGQIDLRYQ